MRVRYREEQITTILSGGHFFDGRRYAFEPEFCCDLMRAAWIASIVAMYAIPAVAMDAIPAVAMAEITVDREANPRMVATAAGSTRSGSVPCAGMPSKSNARAR